MDILEFLKHYDWLQAAMIAMSILATGYISTWTFRRNEQVHWERQEHAEIDDLYDFSMALKYALIAINRYADTAIGLNEDGELDSRRAYDELLYLKDQFDKQPFLGTRSFKFQLGGRLRYLIGYILDHRQLLESSLPPPHILKMVNNVSSEILKAVREVDAELKARRTLLSSRSIRPLFLTRSEIEHLRTLGERQW